MWRFKRLTLVNFRSFENQTFEFRTGETFLVQGENLTDPGFKSNGSGKSSIGEGIRYSLGLPVNTATLTDLINYYSDSCSTILEMENDRSNETMIISRSTPRKGSSTLSIEINGVDQKDKFATVPDGDRFIISKVGISKEDLLNYYLLSKEKFVSFLSSSDNDKKELINRFSKADMLDGIDTLIEKDLKPLREELTILTTELDKLSGKLDTYNEEMSELEIEEGQSAYALIGEANTLILATKVDIVRLEKAKLNWEKRKLNLEANITLTEKNSKDISKKIEGVETRRKAEREKISANDLEKKEYGKVASELESLLAGIVTCPNCDHQFNPAESIDIEETNEILVEANKVLQGIDARVKESEEVIKTLNEEEKKYRKHIISNDQRISRIRGIVNKLLTSINNASKEIIYKETDITYLESQIEIFKRSGKEERKEQLQQKIDAVMKDIETKGEEITAKNEEIYKLSQWIDRFKSFKSHLANKSLFSIQGYANMYLEHMGTNLNLRLDGFKQNKDGSIREKITPTILRNGMVEGSGSFKNYSGGERCRIDLAPTLACQYLINLSSPSGGLDYLMIDEITEGLDSLGVESLAKSIQQIGITCNIISHIKHDSVFDNIITVRKVAGVSEIV